GTLKIDSEPTGAEVLVDGRPRGATPFTGRVAPGDHQVTLRREGFAEQSFPVQVQAGAVAEPGRKALVAAAAGATPATAAVATPAPTTGELLLYTTPPGAHFYLDDEYLGQGDPGLGRLRKSGVAAGAHVIRAVRGEQNVEQPVEVVAGQSTTVRLSLATPEPAGPLPGRLAAALAAVVVLLGAGFWWLRRSKAPAEPETRLLPSRPPSAAPRTAPRTPGRTPASRPTISSSPTLGADDPLSATEALAEIPTPRPGDGTHETFGPFVLTDQLGRGGMASVYRAERNGQFVALKRPLRGFLDEPEFLERFLREAEIGRTLHHHNIIRIFERGDVEGVPYFTMELVDGDTLSSYARRRGPLPSREAAEIVAQVAEALDYAHLKGIVHRDLKPSNIMLMRDGTVKVMDYGIARSRRFDGLTVTGAFLGTPDYVAPETAEGHGTDARSDLYSLGIVFYEILTGQRPFVGETPFATLKKHCLEPPTPPSAILPGVPRELEAMILKLLRKDPAERYPGAEELLIELRDYLNNAAA
ncbi:MAG: protein kinase, partial [Vicinamibacteria bacterium]|nr:protein kinase [Vicinamibacteria bacterium]